MKRERSSNQSLPDVGVIVAVRFILSLFWRWNGVGVVVLDAVRQFGKQLVYSELATLSIIFW